MLRHRWLQGLKQRHQYFGPTSDLCFLLNCFHSLVVPFMVARWLPAGPDSYLMFFPVTPARERLISVFLSPCNKNARFDSHWLLALFGACANPWTNQCRTGDLVISTCMTWTGLGEGWFSQWKLVCYPQRVLDRQNNSVITMFLFRDSSFLL